MPSVLRQLTGRDGDDSSGLAFATVKQHIGDMATKAKSVTKSTKFIGRSAATGKLVWMPVAKKKGTVSDREIATAVKNAIAKKDGVSVNKKTATAFKKIPAKKK
jgi:hypothetical protein